MKSTAIIVVGFCLVLSAPAFAQERGRGQAPPPPATETSAPAIPGVAAAGTKVQVLASLPIAFGRS